ncbi:MAG: hypothetical protein IPL87_01175 [Candidatus Moraniibacteriota bacterium]|nr:MAG: hypothetical protein IPL87_01175 [Candidatus Moranbacteria bacterium]
MNIFGAVLGSLAACLYALRVWQKKERANLATWSIVLVLDVAGLYLAYATGNKEPYIQAGWCIAVLLIFIATWKRKGDWQWTKTESTVLAICVLSVVVWLTSQAVLISLLGYLTAAFLSAWPQAKDYLRHPEVARKSAWVWQVSIVAILFPLIAKLVEGKYDVEHTLIYCALIGLNVIMAALCMRRPP